MELKNALNKLLFILLPLTMMIACTERPIIRQQVGFTVGSVTDPTKTVYGSLVDATLDGNGRPVVPIQWQVNDSIAIYYPQSSSGTNYCIFKVTALNDDSTQGSITEAGSESLKWGSYDQHRFYGLYPAPERSESLGPERFVITIPREQEFLPMVTSSGNDTLFLPPVMKSGGWMYAQSTITAADAGRPVNMVFSPRFSAFTVILDPGENESLTVKSFSISSEGYAMSGQAYFTHAEPSVINVQNSDFPPVRVTDINQTITRGQKLVVTALVLPQSYGTATGDKDGVVKLTFDTNLGSRSLELRLNGNAVPFAPFTRSIIRNLRFPTFTGLHLDVEDKINWDGTIDIYVMENLSWDTDNLNAMVPDWVRWSPLDLSTVTP